MIHGLSPITTQINNLKTLETLKVNLNKTIDYPFNGKETIGKMHPILYNKHARINVKDPPEIRKTVNQIIMHNTKT